MNTWRSAPPPAQARRAATGLQYGLAFAALAKLLLASLPSSALACSAASPGACVDAVSSAVVAPGALRAHGQGRAIESRHDILTDDEKHPASGDRSGASAGDSAAPSAAWGLWFSRDHAQFEDTGTLTPYRADSRILSLGLDRMLDDRWVLGMAFSLEDTKTATPWNNGSQETDGVGISPYAALLLSDLLSVDVALGASFTHTRQDRLGLDPLGQPERLDGRFDNQRWFGAVNITLDYGSQWWEATARAGWLYVHETQDAHAERGTGLAGQPLAPQRLGSRKVHLGQAYAGGELALRFERISPYLGAVYRHDVSRDSGLDDGGLPGTVGDPLTGDRNEVEFTYGARWTGERVAGWVELLHTLDRQNFRNTALQASVHVSL